MIRLINLSNPKAKRSEHFASSGSRKRDAYGYKMNENYGCPRRYVTGQIDVQELIQSYADDVDFAAMGKMLVANKENVIDHFVLNGEVQDITGLPRDIHELNSLHNKMITEYEKLPSDMKALFGSFDDFSKSWKEGRIGNVIETYYQSKVEKKPEVQAEGEIK